MQQLYDMTAGRLDAVDFGAVYPGFHRFPFALYDDESVRIDGRKLPPQGFYGNTTVEFEGRHIAIWRVDQPAEACDPDIFTAGIVHEMFHAFQAEQGMNGEEPDDLKLLQYPACEENYLLKQNENALLSRYPDAGPEERARIFRTVLASRELRKGRFAEWVRQEELIEVWEGRAECAGMLALRQLAPEKFEQKIRDYAGILERGDHLFDPRKNAYFSGVIMRLLEMERAEAPCDIFRRAAEDIQSRQRRLDAFFAEPRVRTEAAGFICGYDPMNQFRLGDRLMATGFMAVNVNGETVRIPCPCVVEMEPGSPGRTLAWWR
ncbi:MAG: hypothetical protein CW338_06525 [Clostridiales bacterium]|nr:hypothetical protein [Clostridiales bacterium]